MAANGAASQTTPAQITHVFMLCSAQIVCVFNFDSCVRILLVIWCN